MEGWKPTTLWLWSSHMWSRQNTSLSSIWELTQRSCGLAPDPSFINAHTNKVCCALLRIACCSLFVSLWPMKLSLELQWLHIWGAQIVQKHNKGCDCVAIITHTYSAWHIQNIFLFFHCSINSQTKRTGKKSAEWWAPSILSNLNPTDKVPVV